MISHLFDFKVQNLVYTRYKPANIGEQNEMCIW